MKKQANTSPGLCELRVDLAGIIYDRECYSVPERGLFVWSTGKLRYGLRTAREEGFDVTDELISASCKLAKNPLKSTREKI